MSKKVKTEEVRAPFIIAIDIETAGDHHELLSLGAAYVYQDPTGKVHHETYLAKVC